MIDIQTFKRVQTLLGDKHYNAHQSVYGSGMVECSHYGHPIVSEIKTKQTKKGEKSYYYYRCAKYTKEGHPRHRATEKEFDAVIMDMFQQMKVDDPKTKAWIVKVLQAEIRNNQKIDRDKQTEIKRQHTLIADQRDRLVNMRMLGGIDGDTFSKKDMELRDKQAEIRLQLDGSDRQQSESVETALNLFYFS